MDILKYVDDFMGDEKLSTELGYSVLSTGRTRTYIHAAQSQDSSRKSNELPKKGECW